MTSTNTRRWTVDPSTFGMDLKAFVTTLVPDFSSRISSPADLSQLAASFSNGFANFQVIQKNDLCPPNTDSSLDLLRIVPFSQLHKVVQSGDWVVFVEKDGNQYWRSKDWFQVLKQRGRHAELITEEDGTLYIRGLWGEWNGDTKRFPVANIETHEMLHGREDWFNLHVFRFVPPQDLDANSITANLAAWINVFPRAVWPRAEWQLDPVDFVTVDDLRKLGDSLITTSDRPEMFCAQWVHALICLSMCYPMTETYLKERGTLDAYRSGFGDTRLVHAQIKPLTALPLAPYTPADVIRSFIRTYGNASLSAAFSDALLDETIRRLPGLPSVPQRTILPITPLCDVWRKANAENLEVSYIATGLADAFCIDA